MGTKEILHLIRFIHSAFSLLFAIPQSMRLATIIAIKTVRRATLSVKIFKKWYWEPSL